MWSVYPAVTATQSASGSRKSGMVMFRIHNLYRAAARCLLWLQSYCLLAYSFVYPVFRKRKCGAKCSALVTGIARLQDMEIIKT